MPAFSKDLLRSLVHAKTVEHDYWRDFQNGLISVQDFLECSLELAGLSTTKEDLDVAQRCLQVWGGTAYLPMVNLARSLQRNGCHTSILSNNNALMYNAGWCRNLVDIALSSHEIGVSKPEPRAYHILLERIGQPSASAVLFVDDKENNIVTARQLGILGFHFKSRDVGMDRAFKELEEYLQELKINYS